MGFRQCDAQGKGGYARLWSVDSKANYSTANITTSRKKPNSNEYETDFQDGYVRLVGDAHKKAQNLVIPANKGLPIQITSCEVQHMYVPEKKRTYTNFVVYAFNVEGENAADSKQKSTGNKSKAKAADVPVVEDDSDDEFVDNPKIKDAYKKACEEDDEDLPF